jgi:hypothetical protein
MARQSARLPQRFPAGTTYVVEGRADRAGDFQVSARYLLFPDGRRLALAAGTVEGAGCGPARRPRPAARRRPPAEHSAPVGL